MCRDWDQLLFASVESEANLLVHVVFISLLDIDHSILNAASSPDNDE